MRLFVALPIPDIVAQRLMLMQGGVPGARWQSREQLHLTLRFIGDVDGGDARAIEDVLAGIDAPAFDLQLHGVGQFGNKQPHALWAAARKSELLDHLQRKVDTAIRRVGQPQDAHKFIAHVTLARRIPCRCVLSLFQQADQRRQHLSCGTGISVERL